MTRLEEQPAARSPVSGRRPRSPVSGRRRWGRRIAAVLFGLLVVLAAEAVCRLAGWGDPNLREDPFVGFAAQRPLFVLSDDGTEYRIPRVRDEYFARDSFAVQKDPQERRIFCLGGSTVQGRPYSIQTSFTTWLELALNLTDDEHSWDVINCGGISYASYRLVPILEECLRYEPDLIILCTGHNEFLEDRSYSDVSRSPVLHEASRLRLVNLAREVIDQVCGTSANEPVIAERTILPMETEPILNFNGGLAAYHRDEPWRRGVVEHFAVNVRRMLQISRSSGVPVLLMQPSSNLRDCPPFKSEHRPDLTQAAAEQWVSLMTAAREARRVDSSQAVRLYQQALAIDPENALAHYELGHAYLALKDSSAARSAFVQARDLDICPLRILTEMEQRLAQIAAEEDVPLLNVHALLESKTPEGILGDGELVDHIHPSIAGHQQIAVALVGNLAEMGFVTPPADWRPSADAAYEAHLAALDSAYFLRGQRMLEGLRIWSQGRADGPPAAERFPARIHETERDAILEEPSGLD